MREIRVVQRPSAVIIDCRTIGVLQMNSRRLGNGRVMLSRGKDISSESCLEYFSNDTPMYIDLHVSASAWNFGASACKYEGFAAAHKTHLTTGAICCQVPLAEKRDRNLVRQMGCFTSIFRKRIGRTTPRHRRFTRDNIQVTVNFVYLGGFACSLAYRISAISVSSSSGSFANASRLQDTIAIVAGRARG